MDFELLKEALFKSDALRADDDIQQDVVERIQPLRAEGWPLDLNPRVREALVQARIHKPYRHQAEAIQRSLEGHDVVLESPTASGKTLAFTAPMLHALLEDYRAHALMIYPMKALAFDQRLQLRKICEPLGIESWPYDGDTDKEHKDAMRASPPQVLLTNPEYLNASFLGHADKWQHFLNNLRYVVIDEMHEYRGFFGSNMALLLRRFFLQLERLGTHPRVFLSTATCANPVEHAKNLTGRDVKLVQARNVLLPKRHFFFVKPEIPEHLYWQIFQLRIENAAIAILQAGLQALIFCPTKRFLEDAFRNCQAKVAELGFDYNQLSIFHADLKHETRQSIQQDIKDGETRVIFTTNALELGLDIGGLDGVVLAGFPSNIMSAWQQIGRAGRGWDRDAFVLFYAMNDPIDQFFVNNINAFLNRQFDHLVVDPKNDQLIENHLPALVQETNGEPIASDRQVLGNSFYDAYIKDGGKPIKGWRPQYYMNLRGSIGRSYKLKRENEEVGQISELRRFREAYTGAIFTFFGRKYRVRAHEEDAVILEAAEPNLRTDAGFYPALYRGQLIDGFAYGDLQVIHGKLNITQNFTGYKLIDERTEEVRESHPSSQALYQNNLHAVWFDVPEENGNPEGIGALENILRVGAMFVIPADRFDTSTWSTLKDGLTVYYYENYEGGIGVARKFFEVWPNVLTKGIEVAQNCPCRSGCQNCIEPAKTWNSSNTAIDKQAGLELAKHLLATEKGGPDLQMRNGRLVKIMQDNMSTVISVRVEEPCKEQAEAEHECDREKC
ncbi:MAG: DEAD/DEAH box helicase [Chloroflexi bacterium]|nr:DEAD/DEAH box helicase [Chloroflexota bacterium]